jgi:hypothetical protein
MSMPTSRPPSTFRWVGISWNTLTSAFGRRPATPSVRLEPSRQSCPTGWIPICTRATRFRRERTFFAAVRTTWSPPSATLLPSHRRWFLGRLHRLESLHWLHRRPARPLVFHPRRARLRPRRPPSRRPRRHHPRGRTGCRSCRPFRARLRTHLLPPCRRRSLRSHRIRLQASHHPRRRRPIRHHHRYRPRLRRRFPVHLRRTSYCRSLGWKTPSLCLHRRTQTRTQFMSMPTSRPPSTFRSEGINSSSLTCASGKQRPTRHAR